MLSDSRAISTSFVDYTRDLTISWSSIDLYRGLIQKCVFKTIKISQKSFLLSIPGLGVSTSTFLVQNTKLSHWLAISFLVFTRKLSARVNLCSNKLSRSSFLRKKLGGTKQGLNAFMYLDRPTKSTWMLQTGFRIKKKSHPRNALIWKFNWLRRFCFI